MILLLASSATCWTPPTFSTTILSFHSSSWWYRWKPIRSTRPQRFCIGTFLLVLEMFFYFPHIVFILTSRQNLHYLICVFFIYDIYIFYIVKGHNKYLCEEFRDQQNNLTLKNILIYAYIVNIDRYPDR